MAGLNVSLCFFLATFALCQAVRRAAKALLPGGTYAHFAREAVGTAQLGACCLEMRMLVELGPWALGFGPDLLLTLVFLLLLVHGATLDGASANPTVSLQRFLLAEASLPSTLLELVAQALGVQAAGALTRLYWAWGLSDLHVLQSLMDPHCSSALRTAVPHGALLEGSCAFLLHLALLRLQGSCAVHRAPAVALLLTAAAGTAGPLTSAFLNPTLAASVTFRCSGHSLLEYIQVYWLGPVTGMLLAVLLYHGRLPRLFQRNLLYSQKSKYRVPRGRPVPGPGGSQTPKEGSRGRGPPKAPQPLHEGFQDRDPGRSGYERSAADATAPHPGRLQKGLSSLDRCPLPRPGPPPPVLAATVEGSSGEKSVSAERTPEQPHPSSAAAPRAGSSGTAKRNGCFWTWGWRGSGAGLSSLSLTHAGHRAGPSKLSSAEHSDSGSTPVCEAQCASHAPLECPLESHCHPLVTFGVRILAYTCRCCPDAPRAPLALWSVHVLRPTEVRVWQGPGAPFQAVLTMRLPLQALG
ncbi:aquaporin-12-like [Budorcas taxicolor]|uniref:aquaporin-12-like n=1 Tax=Budorcas taxicolor TaxID=37181 RepID=UPI0022835679|nr:aquaporin-12-like [Budorcas taxicolor]